MVFPGGFSLEFVFLMGFAMTSGEVKIRDLEEEVKSLTRKLEKKQKQVTLVEPKELLWLWLWLLLFVVVCCCLLLFVVVCCLLLFVVVCCCLLLFVVCCLLLFWLWEEVDTVRNCLFIFVNF